LLQRRSNRVESDKFEINLTAWNFNSRRFFSGVHLVKILILGSAGQLGRDLVSKLQHHELHAWTRANVDLSNSEEARSKINSLSPEVIINCAAYNLVDQAELTPEAAFAVNSDAVRNLAVSAKTVDAYFIQVSTDYVFGLDEKRTTPWKESDAPGPVSAYGLSKLTGEYWTRQCTERHLVVRTCGLYGLWGAGGKGGNFVETMLRVAAAGKPLKVVNDQHCTPSFTLDVASTFESILEKQPSGIIHLVNQGETTWHNFAREIFRISNLEVDLTPITSSEFGARARRPAYSILGMQRLTEIGITPPRPWQEALSDYLAQRALRANK
jgi:dTDP-4-dehydrorhamnose reductase